MKDMSEIVIYKSDTNPFEVSVQLGRDTVWLNQKQMVALFDGYLINGHK